jgi:phosphomannomutase
MMKEDVLIGGEESGGISFKGHIPEGDGILMGLLLIEIVACSGTSLHELVQDLLEDVGPAFYERRDLRLVHPVSKSKIVDHLTEARPGCHWRRAGQAGQHTGWGQIYYER